MSAQPSSAPAPRVTASALRAFKEAGRPIVMITAYDYPSARLVEQAGVDAVLVGDSLGMTVLGFDSTLPVTVDDIVRHTGAVSRACERVLVVADMPFMSYQADVTEGMRNAGRLLAEGGAHAVKLEGATVGSLVADSLAHRGGHPGHGPRRPHAAVGERARRLPHPGA